LAARSRNDVFVEFARLHADYALIIMKRTPAPHPALRAALEEEGWRVAAVEEGDEWWCRELWHLRSTWRPQDSEAFLCFLIDPMDGSRVPGPWTVKASLVRPSQWLQQPGEYTVSCSGNERRWIPALMLCLGRLRKVDKV
jgi:hypothetical protein